MPYNNTPYWTLSAFGVNDTNCPAAAMNSENGCLTLHVNADGKSWPAILQILSLISVDGIQEAGWYTAQGAEVPGFVCSATNVDLPCQLPGDVSTTTAAVYQNWVATSKTATTGVDSMFGWDPEITVDWNYPIPVPGVAFREVGSGPYYLGHANPSVGYTLRANPYYNAPTGCAGQAGCLPEKGQYVQNVIDYWEATDTTGISEVEAGFADSAGFETPNFGTMLSLVQSGQLGLRDFPTLTTSNYGFNTEIDLGCLATIDSSPPHPINIPANAFAYEGLRATLEYGYPYTTAQSVGNVIDAIEGGEPFGGFLPPAESNFYNASTPWPNYNNLTDVFSNPASGMGPGTPRWYWNQAYNLTGSAIYDPQLSRFTPSNPLYIPVLGYTSAPNINAVEVAWGDSVTTITGGVVQFQQYFVPSSNIISSCMMWSPLSPDALWWFGWIPDYPAPMDNWQTAYGGTGFWGAANAFAGTWGGLYGGEYNDSSCGHSNPTMANLIYWADRPNQLIPQDCQGTAYNVTVHFVTQATYTANATMFTQLWGLIQDVYNNLQLTVGAEESNTLFTYAPWIDPASINTGALIGGGGEWCYYGLQGNGLY